MAEAAERLGCSVDTLRRRIKRQEVEARQVPTKHGPAWQLRLGPRGVQTVGATVGTPAGPAAESPQGADGRHADPLHADGGQEGVHRAQGPQRPADPGQEPVGLELVRLVDRLQRENLFLAGQVGFLQAKLQSAEAQILALMAPADPEPEAAPGEEAPDSTGEPLAELEAVPAAVHAAPSESAEASGWWRRVLAWLRG